MIYALEIIGILTLLFLSFLVYRILIHSRAFARFVDRTVEVGDVHIETRLDAAEEAAQEVVEKLNEEIKRKAGVSRSVRNRLKRGQQ